MRGKEETQKVAFHLMTATPQRERQRRDRKAEGKGELKDAKSESYKDVEYC